MHSNNNKPGYVLDSESSSRVGQSDSPTPPNTEEKRMNEELDELKAQVKELQSKVDGLVTTNYAREERFHEMQRQVHEYTSGKPTDRFMRSVISQLTDDCFSAALNDKAIEVAVKKGVEEVFNDLQIEEKIVDHIKENLDVDVTCYL